MEETCELDVIFHLLMVIKMLKKSKLASPSILTGQTMVMSISDTGKARGPGCACLIGSFPTENMWKRVLMLSFFFSSFLDLLK